MAPDAASPRPICLPKKGTKLLGVQTDKEDRNNADWLIDNVRVAEVDRQRRSLRGGQPLMEASQGSDQDRPRNGVASWLTVAKLGEQLRQGYLPRPC
jgi:hypothetical protein